MLLRAEAALRPHTLRCIHRQRAPCASPSVRLITRRRGPLEETAEEALRDAEADGRKVFPIVWPADL
eukprot:3021225-Pleurochrysis_carterae.AAC.1